MLKGAASFVARVLGWAAGLLIILVGLRMFTEDGPSALIIVAGGALLLPPVVRRTQGLAGRRTWAVPVLGLACALVLGPVAMAVFGPTPEERAAMALQREEAAKQREADKIAEAGRKAEEARQKAREQRERDCRDDIAAFVMSQSFVKEALKAPATAEFPMISDRGVSVAVKGNCKFTVVAFVDSQNSFGAMLRTKYSIDMEYLPDTDRWRGSNLRM